MLIIIWYQTSQSQGIFIVHTQTWVLHAFISVMKGVKFPFSFSFWQICTISLCCLCHHECTVFFFLLWWQPEWWKYHNSFHVVWLWLMSGTTFPDENQDIKKINFRAYIIYRLLGSFVPFMAISWVPFDIMFLSLWNYQTPCLHFSWNIQPFHLLCIRLM